MKNIKICLFIDIFFIKKEVKELNDKFPIQAQNMKQNFTKIILKNNVLIYLFDFKDVVNRILNYHKYLLFKIYLQIK